MVSRPDAPIDEIVFDDFGSPHHPATPAAAPPLPAVEPAAAGDFLGRVAAYEQKLLSETLAARHLNQPHRCRARPHLLPAPPPPGEACAQRGALTMSFVRLTSSGSAGPSLAPSPAQRDRHIDRCSTQPSRKAQYPASGVTSPIETVWLDKVGKTRSRKNRRSSSGVCSAGRYGTHAVRTARWKHATASMSAGFATINKGFPHVPISRSTLPATADSTARAPVPIVAKRSGSNLEHRRVRFDIHKYGFPLIPSGAETSMRTPMSSQTWIPGEVRRINRSRNSTARAPRPLPSERHAL